MPIPIITGFNVLDNTPIDGRYIVANTTARDNIDRNSLYEGLQVYVVDANQVQVLTNLGATQTDDEWTPIGSDSGQTRYVSVSGDTGKSTTSSNSGDLEIVGGDGISTVASDDGSDSKLTISLDTPATTFFTRTFICGNYSNCNRIGSGNNFPGCSY